MSKARSEMRKALPPTAMPTIAPVLRIGEEVAAAGGLVVDAPDDEAVVEVDVGRELVVDTPDEEAVVEVDLGKELVEVGDAEVVEVDLVDDDSSPIVSITAHMNVRR
jgi:hypothetical protein